MRVCCHKDGETNAYDIAIVTCGVRCATADRTNAGAQGTVVHGKSGQWFDLLHRSVGIALVDGLARGQ